MEHHNSEVPDDVLQMQDENIKFKYEWKIHETSRPFYINKLFFFIFCKIKERRKEWYPDPQVKKK